MYSLFFKRIFDVTFLGVLFLLTLPLFTFLSFILLFYNRGKIFYFQKRPGKDEKIFSIIKFRTMLDLYDNEGNKLPDVAGITSFGKFLRKFSLDELPQLINVIKGDISIVGPRPLLCEYLPLYNEHQRKRHHVKPGITGWAQINGRNATTWQERFDYDLYYVNHHSFALDIKIIFKTFGKVLTAEGNTKDLERFKGNN